MTHFGSFLVDVLENSPLEPFILVLVVVVVVVYEYKLQPVSQETTVN